VTDAAGLVARYRDRVRREVLEHGVTGSDPRAALAARTRALLRSEVALPPGDLDRLTTGRKITRFICTGKKVQQRDFDFCNGSSRWIAEVARGADQLSRKSQSYLPGHSILHSNQPCVNDRRSALEGSRRREVWMDHCSICSAQP